MWVGIIVLRNFGLIVVVMLTVGLWVFLGLDAGFPQVYGCWVVWLSWADSLLVRGVCLDGWDKVNVGGLVSGIVGDRFLVFALCLCFLCNLDFVGCVV